MQLVFQGTWKDLMPIERQSSFECPVLFNELKCSPILCFLLVIPFALPRVAQHSGVVGYWVTCGYGSN